MDKQEYFRKSRYEGLPNRCPILNYCKRRMYTIYYYSDYSTVDRQNNIIKALEADGLIPKDFDQKSIDIQGESPTWSKSNNLIYYHNTCPEVNLFDSENSLPFAFGIASTDGEWDNFRTDNKFANQECKHYSECSEYSKYYFENKDIKIRKTTRLTSKRTRTGISQKMRFEIFQRDNFTCQYCNRSKADGIKLELDHKTPVSKGGTDDFNNLITSCEDCNQGKSNKII